MLEKLKNTKTTQSKPRENIRSRSNDRSSFMVTEKLPAHRFLSQSNVDEERCTSSSEKQLNLIREQDKTKVPEHEIIKKQKNKNWP